MKLKSRYIALCTALLAVGCSKDSTTDAGGSQGVTAGEDIVIATQVQQSNARTSISGLDVTWAEGDAIGVFNLVNNNKKLTLEGGEGTKSASFTGTIASISQAGYIYAAYPYSTDNLMDHSSMKMTLAMATTQTQSYTAANEVEPTAIGAYALMVARSAEDSVGVEEGEDINFAMSNLYSIIDFKLNLGDIPADATINTMNVTSSSGGFPRQLMVDMSNTNYVVATTSSSSTASVKIDKTNSELPVEAEMTTIRLAVAEHEVANGTTWNITINATVDGVAKNYFTNRSFSANKTIERSKRYTVTVTDELTEDKFIDYKLLYEGGEQITIGGKTISSATHPNVVEITTASFDPANVVGKVVFLDNLTVKESFVPTSAMEITQETIFIGRYAEGVDAMPTIEFAANNDYLFNATADIAMRNVAFLNSDAGGESNKSSSLISMEESAPSGTLRYAGVYMEDCRVLGFPYVVYEIGKDLATSEVVIDNCEVKFNYSSDTGTCIYRQYASTTYPLSSAADLSQVTTEPLDQFTKLSVTNCVIYNEKPTLSSNNMLFFVSYDFASSFYQRTDNLDFVFENNTLYNVWGYTSQSYISLWNAKSIVFQKNAIYVDHADNGVNPASGGNRVFKVRALPDTELSSTIINQSNNTTYNGWTYQALLDEVSIIPYTVEDYKDAGSLVRHNYMSTVGSTAANKMYVVTAIIDSEGDDTNIVTLDTPSPLQSNWSYEDGYFPVDQTVMSAARSGATASMEQDDYIGVDYDRLYWITKPAPTPAIDMSAGGTSMEDIGTGTL